MSEDVCVNEVDGQKMALVPAGRAVFGDGETRFEAELGPYYLGLACVTNDQFAVFLNNVRPSRGDLARWVLLGRQSALRPVGDAFAVQEGKGEHPVIQVSWLGAEAYCAWARVRLPSELEWEKGARGVDGRAYPWGDEWDPARCRHNGNRGSDRTCGVWAHPDGVSPYGLHNASGNVLEWCEDWFDARAYGRYARGDLCTPRKGRHRVARGGCWMIDHPADFRCDFRFRMHPRVRYAILGFRCCRSAPKNA
ncbi:MAG: SUMF1/EgtB/PvdO family nonheme iron enzyme [Acidobacteriota bacterium]|nr:SUMF1/EgtB/PvdO family nonheme iron enzyme [Acidobacteriota bacterium]